MMASAGHNENPNDRRMHNEYLYGRRDRINPLVLDYLTRLRYAVAYLFLPALYIQFAGWMAELKTQITSNIGKVSARYKKMARNLPGIIDKATKAIIEDEALPLFNNTVRTWKHQPRFMARKVYHGYGVEVNPLQPFEWVNKGTKAHEIEARNAPLLRFTGPYHAKTKVNTIASYNGGRGNVWVSKRRVHHPGTEARNFTDIIMRRVQTRAADRMRKALSEASYGAGMGI